MKRDIYKKLVEWKKDPNRKPLVLQGARQAGKTYILQEFGKNEYSDVAYFNFEEDPDLNKFFRGKIIPEKIVEKLSINREKKIYPEGTLIIFDEVQESPETLTSLKYFCESKNGYHIIASGSLLGIKLTQKKSFPVGKVNFLYLYPFSFGEYLDGIGKSMLREIVAEKKDFSRIDDKFHEELIEQMKLYFFIGGMPEAIKQYNRTKDFNGIRRVQKEILQGYEADFSKHTTKAEAMKISKVWNSAPVLLARENKKFVYSAIAKNARGRDWIDAIQWLANNGLIYKSYNIKRPLLPLKAYIEENSFKIFLLDVGLLGAALDITAKTILERDDLFLLFSGAFTENYVAQELIAGGHSRLYYWMSGNTAEVDFVLPCGGQIYPLDAKAGANTKAKSLNIYGEKYSPPILFKTSQNNFSRRENYCNLPLYAVSLLLNETDIFTLR